MGASPPEHLHPQLAFGPGVEPALPCYVFLFGRSLASPLLFYPHFLGGGHQISPPPFPFPSQPFLGGLALYSGPPGPGRVQKKKKIKYRRFPAAGARRCQRSPVLSLRAPGPSGGNQPLVSPCSLRALRGGKYLFSLPSSRLSSSFQLNPVPPRETLTAPVVFYFFSLVDWYYYY